MLDGFHLDISGHAVLPATPWLQEGGELRQGDIHLHARLGHHLRVHRNTRDPRARSQRHIHRIQLFLHLLHEEEAQQRRANPRQGVRDRTGGKSRQPEPLDELRPGHRFLALMDPVRRCQAVRILRGSRDKDTDAALRRSMVGYSQFVLENRHPNITEPPVSLGFANIMLDGVLSNKRATPS